MSFNNFTHDHSQSWLLKTSNSKKVCQIFILIFCVCFVCVILLVLIMLGVDLIMFKKTYSRNWRRIVNLLTLLTPTHPLLTSVSSTTLEARKGVGIQAWTPKLAKKLTKLSPQKRCQHQHVNWLFKVFETQFYNQL